MTEPGEMLLNDRNWEESIRFAWDRVRVRVEDDRTLEFSHEHTLQFHMAWEVARYFKFADSLHVRFEVLCGQDAHGEVIRTDLLFWTDPKFKVAVEMKAPVRSESGMNSAMTFFRMAFYRDIDRLRHLVETRKDGIRRGMFVAVVNERGYIVRGRQKVNESYATYHGTKISIGATIQACRGPNGCEYDLVMPGHELLWNWTCETRDEKVVPSRGMKHFWLDPIPVYPRSDREPRPTSSRANR